MFFLPFEAHHFCWSLALRQVGEYVHAVRALNPLPQPLDLASLETISFLQAFHCLNSSLPCFNFLIQGKGTLTRY
jgi:hypothetical protein